MPGEIEIDSMMANLTSFKKLQLQTIAHLKKEASKTTDLAIGKNHNIDPKKIIRFLKEEGWTFLGDVETVQFTKGDEYIALPAERKNKKDYEYRQLMSYAINTIERAYGHKIEHLLHTSDKPPESFEIPSNCPCDQSYLRISSNDVVRVNENTLIVNGIRIEIVKQRTIAPNAIGLNSLEKPIAQFVSKKKG